MIVFLPKLQIAHILLPLFLSFFSMYEGKCLESRRVVFTTEGDLGLVTASVREGSDDIINMFANCSINVSCGTGSLVNFLYRMYALFMHSAKRWKKSLRHHLRDSLRSEYDVIS